MRQVVMAGLIALALAPAGQAEAAPTPTNLTEIWVDAARGRSSGKGTERSPLRSIAEALDLLPDPLPSSVTVHLAAGSYREEKTLEGSLVLQRRMAEGVVVRFVGELGKERERGTAARPVLDWAPGGYLVVVRDGHWAFENVQFGDRRPRQRLGLDTRGPGHLELRNVRIRVASHSGAALFAQRGGLVELRGCIEINEDFHEKVPENESFAGIFAEDHGTVRFRERDGASLSVGNGSLSAGYCGVVRLGCETARVTSWGGQSNCIAVNNTGRVDLHGTTLQLRAALTSNTPIGLEDDGHVLAEGARIVIDAGEGGSGIVLQKASTLYCGDIEFKGTPKYTLLASSGSNFVGGFLGDVRDVHATTGATIHIGRCTGNMIGPFQATRGGVLSLPDGTVMRGE